MKSNPTRPIVIALGGSIAVPDAPNAAFLKNFSRLIRAFATRAPHRLVIVVGGGGLARRYQRVTKSIRAAARPRDVDLIGIAATKLNAELLRLILAPHTHRAIADNPARLRLSRARIVIVSGWTPGRSTDAVAVRAAKILKTPRVIIAGKPDYVYTADFTRTKQARPIRALSWKRYRALIPPAWSPGMSSPVDPVAAREAQRANIDAVVIAGANLKNLKAALTGKPWKGTLISNEIQD